MTAHPKKKNIKTTFTSKDFELDFAKNAAVVSAPIPSRCVSPSPLQMTHIMVRIMASEEQVIN